MIDLRSDTVTRPTPAMRKAMAEAEVGDDVYGEDPTVNRLEQTAAELLGKEAALFVPTGTMGNTIAIKLHTRHGEELVCDARSHIVDWELSMMAWFAGVIARTIAGRNGILTWPQIQSAIRTKGPHNAPTTLVVIENSHNMGGGDIYSLAALDEIAEAAKRAGLRLHMDGARVFNAATASRVPVDRIAARVDTLMFCLSKGLGAPAGSLLVGPADLIEEGRLFRKRLGGGMRQAGVLAAAGLIALETGPERLHEDHSNAQELASRLAELDEVSIDPGSVKTNIVIFEMDDPAGVSRVLRGRGVLANPVGPRRMRMVTHQDVDRADCLRAVEELKAVLVHAGA